MGRVGELIPLFPLSHVLLPGMPLPLRIFEERYRTLLTDLGTATGARFGVIALRSGSEVLHRGAPSGPPDLAAVGTLAEILEVQPQEDGSAELLAVGSRRFRVLGLVQAGKPYLRADVEFLDEDDGDLDARHAYVARQLMQRYDARLVRLAGRATGDELPTDANQLSYHIGARLPLPPADRQTLLDDATTAQRLRRLIRLLGRELALLERTRSIAVSPTVLRLTPGAN